MNNNKKIQSCLGKNKSNCILQNPSLKPQIKVGIVFFSYPKQNLTLQSPETQLMDFHISTKPPLPRPPFTQNGPQILHCYFSISDLPLYNSRSGNRRKSGKHIRVYVRRIPNWRGRGRGRKSGGGPGWQ